MSELIDRNTLLLQVEESRLNNTHVANSDRVAHNKEHLRFEEMIKAATSVDPQKWISVKDGLPEDCILVLTCDKRGNMHVTWHHHAYKDPFCINEGTYNRYPVTHWMPLPKPPLEVKTE